MQSLVFNSDQIERKRQKLTSKIDYLVREQRRLVVSVIHSGESITLHCSAPAITDQPRRLKVELCRKKIRFILSPCNLDFGLFRFITKPIQMIRYCVTVLVGPGPLTNIDSHKNVIPSLTTWSHVSILSFGIIIFLLFFSFFLLCGKL